MVSFIPFWKGIVRTHDSIPCILNLYHSIGQIPWADMLKRCGEEFPLTSWHDIGNNYDDSGVQWFLSVEKKKVGAIVRDKRVVPLTNGFHELPIFGTTETEVIDMVGRMTRRMC